MEVKMIVTSVEKCGRYAGMHPVLGRALSWIRDTDFRALVNGRVELDGSTLFYTVSGYVTKSPEQAGWEAHRKYIDIQIVTSGTECIDTADLLSLKEKAPYDSDRDYLELEGRAQQSVVLSMGQILVLFPEDAHSPGIHGDRKTAETVTKIVVKVLI